MHISPDDFEKIGIDSSILDEKAEQTTYKIKYVTRYVRQWALIEVHRKEIQQINFIDCMCNAGIYKDGDACTALEVIQIFNELAKEFPGKQFRVYLNDKNEKRIETFRTVYEQCVKKTKCANLLVFAKSIDVNEYLDKVANHKIYSHDFLNMENVRYYMSIRTILERFKFPSFIIFWKPTIVNYFSTCLLVIM